MKKFKILAVLGLLAVSVATLPACNTVDGLGEDLQRAAN